MQSVVIWICQLKRKRDDKKPSFPVHLMRVCCSKVNGDIVNGNGEIVSKWCYLDDEIANGQM